MQETNVHNDHVIIMVDISCLDKEKSYNLMKKSVPS